jgi:4-amino-4-deoxy-L-arabinose transferase-like glycosyltransferase
LQNTSKIKRIFNRYFCVFLFLFALFIYCYLLFSARQCGLLPYPAKGMDQLTMISAAADMYRGKMPLAGFLYSPLYTLFLFFLVVLSQGNLIIMRVLQAAFCSFTPVLIYKLTRKIRIDRESSQIAALLYCFYGAGALISLSFLRAGPLAFCFILFSYLLVNAFIKRKVRYYIYAGAAAALCVLGRENFLPVVFSPFIFLFFPDVRKNIPKKLIIAFFTTFILVILPFSLYNYIRFQSFAIIPGAFENIFSIFHAEQNTRASFDSATTNSIVSNIPVQFCKFFSSYEIPNSLSFYAHKEIIDFMAIFIVPFNFLLGCAIVGVTLFWKNKGVLFVALLIASFCGSMLFFNMLYRYRVPVVPLVSVLAALGIMGALRLKPVYKKIFPIVFVFIFFILTYKSPDKLRPVSERVSVAKYLINIKQYAKAENYIKKLDRDKVNTDELYYMLITALKNDGETEMAKYIMIERYKSLKQQKRNQEKL